MCRKGAWAELTARVTFRAGIQSRMSKKIKHDVSTDGGKRAGSKPAFFCYTLLHTLFIEKEGNKIGRASCRERV